MMLLLRMRVGFIHCNVVIAGLPKVRRYKLATEKRFHGRQKIFWQISKGRISWKFKLRSTKRKDLFFEMSLESSTS
jgi:hypothetical protein